MILAVAPNLIEIFSSVQGEGIHVGCSTLFVRFGECDLRCRWCDTPHSWARASTCRIETRAGTGEFRTVGNPVSLDEVEASARTLGLSRHRFASFTGGEPLLQPEAVRLMAQRLAGQGPRIHLETHGLLCDALAQVIEVIDVVSMDWKLTSDVRRASDPARGPVCDFHAAHTEFLRIACRAPEVVVKVVVTPTTEDAEIDEMTRCVAAVAPHVPLIVQPVTPSGGVREAIRPERLLALAARIERTLSDVRVIPQTHRSYGAL